MHTTASPTTRWSERFKASVIAAAVTDWMSFTGTTEIEHENSLVHWKLWPYDQPQKVWERSPMAHTKDSQTASLIVHGLADTRVPPSQSTELYRALKHAGAPVELPGAVAQRLQEGLAVVVLAVALPQRVRDLAQELVACTYRSKFAF